MPRPRFATRVKNSERMFAAPSRTRIVTLPRRGWYEEYHPYGSTAWHAFDSSKGVSAKRYRYTGMERDEETGLQYHSARYYAPWLGRWTGSDPIGLGDGVNRYAYARANPGTTGDTSGLAAPDAAPFSGSAVTGAPPERIGLLSLAAPFAYKKTGMFAGLGAKYDNPLKGSAIFTYLSSLSSKERTSQVHTLFSRQATSSTGGTASRVEVITAAANEYNVPAQLVAAIILAEQRDQSAAEDAKEGAAIRFGDASVGLGQVRGTTAIKYGLINPSLLSSELTYDADLNSQGDLSAQDAARALVYDDVNIWATAKYVSVLMEMGTQFDPQAKPGLWESILHVESALMELGVEGTFDPGGYADGGKNISIMNIVVLGSEYTRTPWIERDPGSQAGQGVDAWGLFVGEAFLDVQRSGIFE